MDYFGQGLGSNPATQEFSTYGGLNDCDQAFCVPGVQNGKQEAAPQQLDARPKIEPMGHDQAIPAPQASSPLTPSPVEIKPDNGTNT